MKKTCGLILALLMLLMLAMPGIAAEERYYPLTETGTEGGFYYACRGIRFFSSVGSGEKQYGEVILRTDAACSLYSGGAELTPETVSGGEKTYRFAESGSYSLTIRGEERDGIIPYSTFSFSVKIVSTGYASGELDFGNSEPVGTLYTIGTGTYITDVLNGETRTGATAIYFTEDLEVSYTRDGGPAVKYSSGAGLSGTGSYVFTISGKEENGMPVSMTLRFTIEEARVSTPEIGQQEDLLGPAPSEDSLADYSENTDSGYVPGGGSGWSGDEEENTVNREVDPGKQEDSGWSGGGTLKPEDAAPGGSSGGSQGSSGSAGGEAGSGSPGEDGEEPVAGDYTENGVTVVEVSLQEVWHARYGQYSQQVRSLYFYTNVSNGGIIGEAVWFELPEGLSATLSDGGGVRPLVSGEGCSEAGTYVLTVDERVGDVIYRGKLNFRILPVQSTPAPQEPSGGSSRSRAATVCTSRWVP